MMRRISLFACSFALAVASAGCQGEGGTNGATPPTNATNAAKTPSVPLATATASAIASGASTAPVASDEPPQPAPAPPPATTSTALAGQPGAVAKNAMTVIVVPATGVTSAEDGHGAVVAANDPVFLD